MANLIIPVGMPGTGKSTWARTILKHHIVSSDDIRLKLFGSLKAAHDPETKKANNEQVWDVFYREIEILLEFGKDVVADATNLRFFARERLREIADRTGAKVHIILFTNYLQAFDRNEQRPEDEIVPRDVMNNFLRQYLQTETSIRDASNERYDTITRIGSLE